VNASTTTKRCVFPAFVFTNGPRWSMWTVRKGLGMGCKASSGLPDLVLKYKQKQALPGVFFYEVSTFLGTNTDWLLTRTFYLSQNVPCHRASFARLETLPIREAYPAEPIACDSIDFPTLQRVVLKEVFMALLIP
jgi:hypothetical protein